MEYFIFITLFVCVWLFFLPTLNKNLFAKTIVPILFLYIGFILFSITSMKGTDRPVQLHTLINATKEVKILNFYLVENVAIYLWIKDKTQYKPLYVSIPWNEGIASELVEATQDANGGEVYMRLGEEPTEEYVTEDNNFRYELPIELPPKTVE